MLIFNFFLFRGLGDPTTQLARLPQTTPEEIEELRAEYGLDKPLWGSSLDYAGDTLTLELGVSQSQRAEPVWDEIKAAIPWTLLLVGVGTLIATIVGGMDGGEGRDETRHAERTTACWASTCSPTPRPSTGSGSS